jgi:hypothetical protein
MTATCLEERWGDSDTERIRVHAMELVTLKPDAILAAGIRALTALQRETRIIPIVFVATADLAALGIVASLGSTRWQRHWICDFRVFADRQIAGDAQANYTQCRACRPRLSPG